MNAPATADGKTADKPTLLFVDDEPRVLTAMRAMFRRDYKVLTADCAAEALKIVSRQRVAVLVSDQRMPGTTGVELLADVKTLSPDTARILLTGYADLQAIESALNDAQVYQYLMKPCAPDEIRSVVSEAIALPPAYRPGASRAPAGANSIESIEIGLPDEPEQDDVSEGSNTALPLPEVSTADVLVFSTDDVFASAVAECVPIESETYRARSREEAQRQLEQPSIGVLITDTVADPKGIAALLDELASTRADLVTLVASSRSDAMVLIGLINQGRVFRFLIKPVQRAQCAIWIRSAINRYLNIDETELFDTDLAPPGWLDRLARVWGSVRRRLGSSQLQSWFKWKYQG